MSKTSKAQLQASKKYLQSKDRIQTVFPAGTRNDIEKYLEVSGCNSVSDFIRDCVITKLCEYNLRLRKNEYILIYYFKELNSYYNDKQHVKKSVYDKWEDPKDDFDTWFEKQIDNGRIKEVVVNLD